LKKVNENIADFVDIDIGLDFVLFPFHVRVHVRVRVRVRGLVVCSLVGSVAVLAEVRTLGLGGCSGSGLLVDTVENAEALVDTDWDVELWVDDNLLFLGLTLAQPDREEAAAVGPEHRCWF